MKRTAPYLLILAISALFFWKFLLVGRIPIDSTALYQMRPWSQRPDNPPDPSAYDTARYYHNIDPIVEVLPVKGWMAEHLRSGNVPLWNPSLFSGVPFAANHHAAPWDFSTIIFLIFPEDIAFGFILLLHLFIAGACMFFYCRILEFSRTSSFLAATSFMFNNFFLHWLGLISFNAGLIWMPLIPAGVELAFRRGSVRPFLISAAALGLVFLSGMAQFWLFNAFLLFTYTAYRWYVSQENRRIGLASTGLGIVLVLGAGLGAVQLNQTLSALKYSSRGSDAQASLYEGRNHLSPRRLGCGK